MDHEQFEIEIEGEAMTDIYEDLLDFEVELDSEMASLFKIRMALSQESDGVWKYIDDERFSLWKAVTISAGFEDDMAEIISGYITHARPFFDAEPGRCVLEVWGMDRSIVMDREEKLKDWPSRKDSDIASEIFNTYGFTPDVEDTVVVHDEALSTIIQRETDMQFLRRLAARNGFECYVEEGSGYFKPPQLADPPQPILAVHFGDETNVNTFSLEADALMATSVAMSQIDRSTKENLDSSADTAQLTALGARDAAALVPPGVDAARIYAGMNVTTGEAEMTALCRSLYDEYSWFVTGEGELHGNRYGHVLRPHKTVTIKGIGETHSGVYYVTHVTHAFTSGGYRQHFRVKRNGLGPTGSEDFSSSGASGGLL